MASGHSGSAWSDADEERLQAMLKLRAAAKAPIPLLEDAGAMGECMSLWSGWHGDQPIFRLGWHSYELLLIP